MGIEIQRDRELCARLVHLRSECVEHSPAVPHGIDFAQPQRGAKRPRELFLTEEVASSSRVCQI